MKCFNSIRKILFAIVLITCFSDLTAQVNLNKGLVAYYPFNGSFNDASGNGNHGTGQNGVTFTADQWSNPNDAAFFDGIDDWINVGVPSFTFGHNFSIAFRFKTNSSVHQCILSRSTYWGAPVNLQYQIAFNHPIHNPKGLYLGTNHTGTCAYGPSGDFSDFGITQEQIPTSQWNCVVITFNNGAKSIYLNGTLRLQTSSSVGAFPTTVDSCTAGTLRIGTWWQSDPRYYSGILDELRFYNRTLNKQEIDSLCNLITVPTDTVINKYAAVNGRDCDNSFEVDTAKGFAPGDTVLLIQMKGAIIDSSNSTSFGNLLNQNGAGNYELNVVKAVSGNKITLLNKLQKQYDIPYGKVQIVRVPTFTNYFFSRRHGCVPWNGRKGGVFIISVTDTLSMNADIDVSGQGFRGGKINNGSSYSCDKTDFFYPLSGNDGGEKGEGVSEISSQMMRGKGKLATGGGGGNSANAGGGGGSGAHGGGAGGNQLAGCNQSLSSGGIGGISLPVITSWSNRLYFGGGGGAGQENNGFSDPGGDGGGIVVVIAGKLLGNGRIIKANGSDCFENNTLNASGPSGDGQGGGGGGGTVWLKVSNFLSLPSVEVKGGAGGNVYATSAYGPGGGGGGGNIVLTNTPGVTMNLNISGGVSGRAPNFANVTHGAQPGQPGEITAHLPLTTSVGLFAPNKISVGFTDTFVSCLSRRFISSVSTTTSGIASYQWSAGSLTSSLPNPLFTFPGKGTYLIRLIVTDSNGCRDTLVKQIVIDYPPFAEATGDTSICVGQAAVINASGGVAYSWSPAEWLADSSSATTNAWPRLTTTYVVTVTDLNGCVDRDSVTVTVIPSPTPIIAFPSDTVICNGSSLQLNAINGKTYSWSPAGYLNNPNIANPVAMFVGNIRYIVTGTDISGCLSSDTVNIRSAPDPVVDASSDGTAINCDHAGVTLYASGAVTYTWSPAEYLDDFKSASPLASPPGTMVFTVTGYDSIGCAGTDTITVFSAAKAKVFLPDAFTPNGDGRNDRIRPIAWCDFKLAEFRIFNRWGQCVFYGYTGEHYWDGTFGGRPAPMDVYFYFIRGLVPSTGEEVLYKGDVTLLR